jgi:hypothetical protein
MDSDPRYLFFPDKRLLPLRACGRALVLSFSHNIDILITNLFFAETSACVLRCVPLGPNAPESIAMPIEKVPGSTIKYYLIAHNAEGQERQDDPDGQMSRLATDAARDPTITDVFLISHGWRGDVPAVRLQYAKWIAAMASCADDVARMRKKRPNFRPLLIGLHWPSEPWGDETFAGAVSFDTAGADPVEELVDEAAAKTVDTPAARVALRTIVTAALEDNNPPHLPPQVQEAYAALDHELALGHAGEAAPPGHDRERFDAEAVYREGQSSAVSFGGFTDGVLSPLTGAVLLEDEGPGPPLRRGGGAPPSRRSDGSGRRPRREVSPGRS